jgi:hypothetical protein
MPDENRLLLVLFEHRPIFCRQESLLRMGHTGSTPWIVHLPFRPDRRTMLCNFALTGANKLCCQAWSIPGRNGKAPGVIWLATKVTVSEATELRNLLPRQWAETHLASTYSQLLDRQMRKVGLEPTWANRPPGPEPGASANSATSAYTSLYKRQRRLKSIGQLPRHLFREPSIRPVSRLCTIWLRSPTHHSESTT